MNMNGGEDPVESTAMKNSNENPANPNGAVSKKSNTRAARNLFTTSSLLEVGERAETPSPVPDRR